MAELEKRKTDAVNQAKEAKETVKQALNDKDNAERDLELEQDRLNKLSDAADQAMHTIPQAIAEDGITGANIDNFLQDDLATVHQK